jgi:hypothetical protein
VALSFRALFAIGLVLWLQLLRQLLRPLAESFVLVGVQSRNAGGSVELLELVEGGHGVTR